MESVIQQIPGSVLDVSLHDGRWLVLKTRPRCEKRVLQRCEELGVSAYLPLHMKTYRYGGRVREFSSPLFPGYVFCVVTPDQRTDVLQCRHVVRGLEVVDQSGLQDQLLRIERALQVQEMVEVMPFLKEGAAVRVRSGPLKGLAGMIRQVKGRTRVVINVDMIQQAVAVEVDGADLAPG